MGKIRIVKKNDEYSSEYQIGDVFKIEGTWYGGVHILGRTGVPVSLDKEEYEELDVEGGDAAEKAVSERIEKDEENSGRDERKKSALNASEPESEADKKDGMTFPGEEKKRTGNDPGAGKTGTGCGKQMERELRTGDIVQHFKREGVSRDTSEYLYKILAIAEHTETGEKLVIYQALYAPFKIYARPYTMFMSKVDREKYPDSKQEYRFKKVEI